MTQIAWTDDRVELLRRLWSQGLSASQIAAELGDVSRNAVIGKVHRLGLSGRATVPEQRGDQNKRLARSERYFRLEKGKGGSRIRRNGPWLPGQPPPETLTTGLPRQPMEASMEERSKTACTILELTASTCRWPLWGAEAREGLYCGARTVEGQPYCRCHCRMAYVGTETKRPYKEWQHWRAA